MRAETIISIVGIALALGAFCLSIINSYFQFFRKEKKLFLNSGLSGLDAFNLTFTNGGDVTVVLTYFSVDAVFDWDSKGDPNGWMSVKQEIDANQGHYQLKPGDHLIVNCKITEAYTIGQLRNTGKTVPKESCREEYNYQIYYSLGYSMILSNGKRVRGRLELGSIAYDENGIAQSASTFRDEIELIRNCPNRKLSTFYNKARSYVLSTIKGKEVSAGGTVV